MAVSSSISLLGDFQISSLPAGGVFHVPEAGLGLFLYTQGHILSTPKFLGQHVQTVCSPASLPFR